VGCYDPGCARPSLCARAVRDWVVENHGEYPPRPVYFT
jgi:hypothetical protein